MDNREPVLCPYCGSRMEESESADAKYYVCKICFAQTQHVFFGLDGDYDNVSRLAYEFAQRAFSESLIASLRASYGQVTKALQEHGFSDFGEAWNELSQVKMERDAAVRDIKSIAFNKGEACGYCLYDNDCDCFEQRCHPWKNAFEWRGLCAENGVAEVATDKNVGAKLEGMG